jgi:hypothetical protein
MALSATVTERWMEGPKRYSRGEISTNNTTYAAGGLALPAKESFGFVRSIDTLQILGDDAANATAYVYSWDKSAGKLMFYVSHDTAGATALPLDEEGADATGTRTLTYIASGW